MATQIYTFKITYVGCAHKIWRVAAVSSNETLGDLGYLVLTTFDTMAYHLFEIKYKNVAYLLSMEEKDAFSPLSREMFGLLSECKLSSLNLKPLDILEMIYDFGCNQRFEIQFLEASDMPRGHGRAYPKILSGEGRGILEDVYADELLQIIRSIDRGQHSQRWYPPDSIVEWDYRSYSLDYDNALLKGERNRIKAAYETCEV